MISRKNIRRHFCSLPVTMAMVATAKKANTRKRIFDVLNIVGFYCCWTRTDS